MIKLYIVADFNDADYGNVLVEISEEVFDKFRPLIDAINEFQPYIRRSSYSGIDYSNWYSYRLDLGELSLYDKYSQFSENYIDEFSEIFIDPIPIPYEGIECMPPHTIKSIKNVITDEEYLNTNDIYQRHSSKVIGYLTERDRLGSYKRPSDGKNIYSIPFVEMTEEESKLLKEINNLWKKYI